ncbi:MAG: SDR family oxidoreductase [Bacteroidota bacterium]|nr:SDR family oxidoreductase [Bacteroidota bacterium]
MELGIKNKLFIVCGASSGFGRAVAEELLAEGAKVIIIARSEQDTSQFEKKYPGAVSAVSGDLKESETLDLVEKAMEGNFLEGIFVNAGGPPPKSIEETEMQDWDQAYHLILRWKVDLVKRLLPKFKSQQYGRILFLESVSVKQPVENLVLSTSLRLAVVGFAKTLSQEVAKYGITANVMGPAYHDTQAMQRLYKKRAEKEDISVAEAKMSFEREIPVGKMGEASELASLAVWLLSPLSRYITGQTFSLDGGTNKFIFG